MLTAYTRVNVVATSGNAECVRLLQANLPVRQNPRSAHQAQHAQLKSARPASW